MNGLGYITAALQEIGALGSGDTVEGSGDVEEALVHVNRMFDDFAADQLTMLYLLRTTKALASGTASYTIGTGGDVNIVRPDEIQEAALVQDSTAAKPVEFPLDVLDQHQYARIPVKTAAGYPRAIFYDRAFSAGLGRVWVFPIPNVANMQLVLYSKSALVAFTALTSKADFTFAPGYQSLFHYHLALRLAGPWGRPVTQELKDFAAVALDRIQRRNVEVKDLQMDPALVPAPPYNIWSGQ